MFPRVTPGFFFSPHTYTVCILFHNFISQLNSPNYNLRNKNNSALYFSIFYIFVILFLTDTESLEPSFHKKCHLLDYVDTLKETATQTSSQNNESTRETVPRYLLLKLQVIFYSFYVSQTTIYCCSTRIQIWCTQKDVGLSGYRG